MKKYFAVCAKGIEEVLAGELTSLGASQVKADTGGVYFEGDASVLYQAHLWLRTASRILMPFKEFAAANPEMLYDQVRRIKWDQYLDLNDTFAIECVVAGDLRKRAQEDARERDKKNSMTHSQYVALKIKDAIADEMRKKMGARPNVDVRNPSLRIHAHIHSSVGPAGGKYKGTRCTLSFDASGKSLHERGYRFAVGHAPMKETLAAALIELTGWNAESGAPLVDPMCGSGTLILEAALQAMNIAPGLFRDEFAFMRWRDFDADMWKQLREDAIKAKKNKVASPLLGFDSSRAAIEAARANAKRLGLSGQVKFEVRELRELNTMDAAKPGVLLTNPPYGERLGDVEKLKPLYKRLGDLMKQRLKGWTAFVFTGNLELAKSVGLRTSKRVILYNGPIECRLLKYDLY